ncbi:hypothetical protein Droror1_Dr00026641 [Drosera rotundifolia]
MLLPKNISRSLVNWIFSMHRKLITSTNHRANPILKTTHLNHSSLSQPPNCIQNPETKQHILHYLLHSCLEQCKKIHARKVFDEMAQRVSQALETGKLIHGLSIKFGFGSDGKMGNAVLDLYAKCGSLELAEIVFEGLEKRDVLCWNSVFSMYSRIGRVEKVVGGFGLMKSFSVRPNQFTYAAVFSGCAKLKVVCSGKQVHCDVIKMGFECDPFCESSIIDMYAKFRILNDARRVFDEVGSPSMASWTAMISAYIEIGVLEEALRLLEKMQHEVCVLDQVASVAIIGAYTRLGRISEAYDIFYKMPCPNSIAWNLMIAGYLKNGREAEAVDLFLSMRKSGIKATRPTLASVLSAAASVEAFCIGVSVHAQAIKQGLENNVYVGSSLINMYGKCQNPMYARLVFDSLDDRNTVLWNAMLGGYSQNGSAYEVIGLFIDMKQLGLRADEFTYTSVLSACACVGSLLFGPQLHSNIIKNGFEANLFVGNALTDMYAKSGALTEARQQFELIQHQDNVSWNAIIGGYVQEEEEWAAWKMFKKMRADGPPPDEASLASISSACANLEDLRFGQNVHSLSVKYGLETSLYVGSSLIDMYVKCGTIPAASQIFYSMPRWNVVSMNSLIAGYGQKNLVEAVELYRSMQAEGLQPSEITFTNLLDACHGPLGVNFGRQIHCLLHKNCLLYIDLVLGISLVSMYMNCLQKTDAINIFSDFCNPKGTILWTAMISGLNQNDSSDEALQLYRKMHKSNVLPDQATFASVLKACSVLTSARDGVKIHCFVFHTGFAKDELVGSALIDMYAKCGAVTMSMKHFKEMDSKWNIITWNSMIAGLGRNGYAVDALDVFYELLRLDILPDDATFLGALTACSHSGRISEGRNIFDLMTNHFGIQPRIDHSACMIDLLGRHGLLDEAESFIDKLKVVPDAIWASFLSACRLHGDEQRGRRAADKLIELEAHNSSAYSLLANIYASSGNWTEFNTLRQRMRENGVHKLSGFSWIGKKEASCSE